MNARLARNPRLHQLRKPHPVDRERRSRRHRGFARAGDDQRADARQLFLEQADRILQRRAAQRVAAHELGERAGAMRRSAASGAHLEKVDLDAAARGLPRRFAAGESASDNR